jgi:hypothetical protein
LVLAARRSLLTLVALLSTGCLSVRQEVWIGPRGEARVSIDYELREPLTTWLRLSSPDGALRAHTDTLRDQLARTPGVRSAVVRESKDGERQHLELEILLDDARSLERLGRAHDGAGSLPSAAFHVSGDAGRDVLLRIDLEPGVRAASFLGPVGQFTSQQLADALGDSQVVVRVHGPRIAFATGVVSRDRKSARWTIRTADLLAPDAARRLPQLRARIDLHPFPSSLVLGSAGGLLLVVGLVLAGRGRRRAHLTAVAVGLLVPAACVAAYILLTGNHTPPWPDAPSRTAATTPVTTTGPPAAETVAAPPSAAEPQPPASPYPTPTDISGPLLQLQSANLRGRLAGIQTLGDIGPAARPALPALVPLLLDPDALIQVAAARAIARIGPDDTTVRSLMQRLSSAGLDPLARVEMACAVGRTSLASVAVSVLDERLGEPDEIVIARTAECLGEIGPAAARSVPGLVRILNLRPSAYARFHAAQALGRIGGPPAADAIPALVQASRDADANVARAAQEALTLLQSAPAP